MKLEKLERNKRKKIVIGVVIFLCFISAIMFMGSRAKYKVTESIPLVNGTINYEIGDFNAVAMYQASDSGGYTEITKMPESGYEINEDKSYCKVNGEVDNNARLYTNSDGEHVIANLQKNSKCYVWFDVKKDPKTVILAGRNKAERGEITAPLTSNGNTVYYEAEDDDGVSQYLAGNVTNNWVQFAGFYWRIIRINGDGSIRIIYNGNSTDQVGTNTQIQSSEYNTEFTNNAYVGFMYGATGASTYEGTHTNTSNSTIKDVLDVWYKTNIVDKGYSSKISSNAGFCNDRSIAGASEIWWSSDTKLGYGTNATAYGAFNRNKTTTSNWNTTQTPTYKCAQQNDLFTSNIASIGNKKLTYPVGLITMDEVTLAGGFGGTANSEYYLYTNTLYWTISPSHFVSMNAFNYYVNKTGSVESNIKPGTVGNGGVNLVLGVRPVINLSSDVTITGSGTTSDPYKVV